MKKEIVDNDEILNFVNEKEEDEADRTIETLKKDYEDKIRKLEEALNNYLSENDLKVLRTEFHDKLRILKKNLAHP